MNRQRFASAIAIMALSMATHSADKDLWPSEVVTLINQTLLFDPSADRRSVTGPLMARMRTDELTEIETFFIAEAHFLNLEPEPARDAYWAFRDRQDYLGRVAFQRLMIIRINAFGMATDIIEDDVPEYSKRFPVEANDRYGVTYPLSQTARSLLEQDRATEALDLIVQHVRQHKAYDSAYVAYQLPGQFLDAASQAGRAAEFIDLHNEITAGLDAAIARRLASTPEKPGEIPRLPGVVFRSLFEDRALDHYGWTAEMIKLRDQLKTADTASE